MMKKRWIIVFFLLILGLLCWLIPLVKCEFMTIRYHNLIFSAYEEDPFLGDVSYIKVLDVSEDEIKLYCVGKNFQWANTISYSIKQGELCDGIWLSTIWSVNGTADDIVWPYWWHFFLSH